MLLLDYFYFLAQNCFSYFEEMVPVVSISVLVDPYSSLCVCCFFLPLPKKKFVRTRETERDRKKRREVDIDYIHFEL